MDFSNLPLKSEATSWKPRTLANGMTTGMTERQPPVFPRPYVRRTIELQKTTSDRKPGPRVNFKQPDEQAFEQEDYEQYDPECGNIYKDGLDGCCKINQRHENDYQEGSVHKNMCLSTCASPPQSCSAPPKRPARVTPKAHTRAHQPLPPQSLDGSIKEAFDPTWYGGEMTRQEAELALRDVDQDGAFVVRDSSKGRAKHPYTLMVLKEAKVYNVKIRKEEDMFFLGTGRHNDKSFPGVREIITHYAHTPLPIIEATDRGSETQRSLCRLLHPVGLRR